MNKKNLKFIDPLEVDPNAEGNCLACAGYGNVKGEECYICKGSGLQDIDEGDEDHE